MNHDTLLRFTKDQKVPINIFDEPYFSYFFKCFIFFSFMLRFISGNGVTEW